MTEGKGHMAFDQVCELLMCWLKRFPSTPFLPSVINKSKHVSLIRRCALELWGKGLQYSSSRLTSNESEVKRIMEVFRASRILDPSDDVVTMDDGGNNSDGWDGRGGGGHDCGGGVSGSSGGDDGSDGTQCTHT